MSDEVRVQPSDLTAKANQIRGLTWPVEDAQPPLITPDALIISSVAITNLGNNAESLWAYQKYGMLEGARLAQSLDNVADAYAQVDQQSGEGIGSTFDVPGGAAGGPVMPRGVDIPPPPHPPKMPIPKGQLASEQGFMDPQAAQIALDAGDDGKSLDAAATMWRANAQSLAASAETFEVNSTNWEGQAADAAYAKFNAYREWLVSLSGAWNRLADEADAYLAAHDQAKSEHRPIAQRYRELTQQISSIPPYSPGWVDAMNKIAEEQKKSEELRNTYAREAVVNQIDAEEPPAPVSGIPVTPEDHQRAKPYREGEQQGGGGGGQQAPGGGSGGGAPQESPTSPMSAGDPAAQAAQAAQQAEQQAGQQGGGSPSGGSPGGGQPGGGQPGGGAPGGGMPGLGKGDPKSPSDPRLRPAAAKGGGGAGAGGGSGGGGLGGVPLQPAVSAETVAPTPYAASAGPAAAGAAGAAGGAMAGGGGMGGMAPMHGAHGAGGSGEKKRNPQLSQDEEIYVEERPHTEPVIGLQPRRRPGSEGTRKES